MGFQLVGKEEMAAAKETVNFNVELIGKPAEAFKRMMDEAATKGKKVSQKDAANQMIVYCLKESGYLKG